MRMVGKIWISRWVSFDVAKSFHKGDITDLLYSWNMKGRANRILLYGPFDNSMSDDSLRT